MVSMGIHKRIKILRNDKGWTQQELSERVGCSKRAIETWEQAQRTPNPTQRKKLCEVFGITEPELFGEPPRIEVQDIEVPIVSSAGATDENGRSAYIPFQPPYERISFKGCKAIAIESNSMAPIAYRNQKIIYSEMAVVNDGDLVFIKLKNGDQLFKRYIKNPRNHCVLLQSINPVELYETLLVNHEDVEFCYKVVGVKF